MKNVGRVDADTYAMMLAYVASLRSEDPYRKVGAVALDEKRYVVGLAYNGLKSGVVAESGFWRDREARRKFMIHAEQNLCGLFKRGQVHTVAVTTCPCPSCANLLAAHGVKRVIYGEPYTDDSAKIFRAGGIALERVPLDKVIRTLRVCKSCK